MSEKLIFCSENHSKSQGAESTICWVSFPTFATFTISSSMVNNSYHIVSYHMISSHSHYTICCYKATVVSCTSVLSNRVRVIYSWSLPNNKGIGAMRTLQTHRGFESAQSCTLGLLYQQHYITWYCLGHEELDMTKRLNNNNDTKSCPTLRDPMDQSTPGPPASRSLVKFMLVASITLSNHLVLCCPFCPLALTLSQHQGLFQGVFSCDGWSIEASASGSVLPVLISFRIDRFDLLAVQGMLKHFEVPCF